MTDTNHFRQLIQSAIKHQNDNEIVDPKLVNVSQRIIHNSVANTLGDAFALASAFNYLNFAVKQRPEIGYEFKSLLENATYVIHTADKNVLFYYSIQEDALYISFYSFVFSFHCPGLSVSLKRRLSQEQPIQFDGIRKQKCAGSILKCALKNPDCTYLNRLDDDNNGNYSKYTRSNNTMNKNSNCLKMTYDYYPYSLNDIIRDYHLRELTTSKDYCNNIAIVIKSLFNYHDMINSNMFVNEPYLERAMFREIITQSYSVLEVIELEIGALLLHINRQTKSDDEQCRKELDRRVKNIGDKEKRKMDEFRQLRNNVHLSKSQSIADEPQYSRKNVEYWFNFMKEYVNYLYMNYNSDFDTSRKIKSAECP